MKEFKTENQISQWLEENYNDLIMYIQNNCESNDDMNPAKILYGYGGNGYRLYNPVLRLAKDDWVAIENYFAKTNEVALLKEIQILDQFIINNPLQVDIVLYRYDSIDLSKILRLYCARKGTIDIDYGFSSTTLLPYTEGMKSLRKEMCFHVLYRYYTKKGVPAVPVKFTSRQSYLNEFEMLLVRGIKRKLVRKSFDYKSGLPFFEFEILFEQ